MRSGCYRRRQAKTPDRRSDQTQTVIYFLYTADNADYDGLRVKLGRARDLHSRLAQHKKGGGQLGHRPAVCEPLCAVQGKGSDEDYLKRYFSGIAWPNEVEVFHPRPQIVDYIRWLRDQYFVWVPDDDWCLHIDDQPILDFSLWMPDPTRVKHGPPALNGFNGPLNMPSRVVTTDDFYTSAEIIEPARKLFGGIIDLDPASHAAANGVVKARRFFSQEDDGLSKPWAGNVWLNPPFSAWKAWVGKLLSEWSSGRVKQLCVLAATRTITAQYFTPLVQAASAVCIFRGRIPFWGGHATSSPDEGHVVFYFGNEVQRFIECFSEIGVVYANPTGKRDD